MKNLKRVMFASLLLLSFFAISQTASTQAGVFEFVEETINYGKIEQNEDGTRKFTFKNVGTEPIVISGVKGSCGCTVATKPEKPVLPNEIGEIKVKYATNRLGKFTKSITVTSNSSEPTKVLKIKGNVLPKQVASTN